MDDGKTMRYSAQRRLIYETLQRTKIHPDVDWIYGAVRAEMPEIGIATVYRNLRQLVAAGLVNTLETTENSVHYDADTSEHMHFVCERCGAIKDIFIDSGVTARVEKDGYKVNREKMMLYGICPECNEKN